MKTAGVLVAVCCLLLVHSAQCGLVKRQSGAGPATSPQPPAGAQAAPGLESLPSFPSAPNFAGQLPQFGSGQLPQFGNGQLPQLGGHRGPTSADSASGPGLPSIPGAGSGQGSGIPSAFAPFLQFFQMPAQFMRPFLNMLSGFTG